MRTQANPKVKLTPEASRSYKIGVDEVVGLREALESAMTPVRDSLRERAYWNRELEFEALEYKSRDGFIAHSHNCGGVELSLHVPECESSDWSCLEFGELTEEYTRDVDPYENEGELDAYLRIILKFEGFDDDGSLKFYINASGGNADAPYFRVSRLPDLFEAEFSCKSVAGIRRAAAAHVRRLLEVLGE